MQLLWTSNVVILKYIGKLGSSVGQTYASSLQLDDATVESFRVGDKLTFVSWCNYLCLTYSMKGIILFFYQRLVRYLYRCTLLFYDAMLTYK